jgi:class 3 adenylate cyclase
MDPIASADSQRSVAEQLSVHLPRLLTRRLASRGALPDAPSHEALAGAFLFCDISGFTALTEKLAPLGPRGAEQLSELLNDFYGRMVERIHAFGGDVVAFAGDAALAIWPGAPASALRAAAECALSIRRELSGAEPQPGVTLRVRSALGVGRLDAYELGGVGDRWFAVVAGEAIEQAKAADGQAYPGDVVLSAEAAALLGGDASTWPLDAGAVRLRALRGEGAARTSAPAPDVAPAPVLAAYLPEVVATRVALGQAEFLAEFRPMTVAFISLGQASPVRGPSLEPLQAAVTTIQRELARFEGGVYQCLRDDKGFVLIAVFGMPPRAHEDDAARACLAALDIRERLLAQGQRAAIGIASGSSRRASAPPSASRAGACSAAPTGTRGGASIRWSAPPSTSRRA